MVIFCNLSRFNLTKQDLEFIYLIDSQNFSGFNRWDKEDFLYYITNKNYLFSVLKKDELVIGFCLSFISGFDSELYKIAVYKDYQNLGFGKLLLTLHLSYLVLFGVEQNYLEVNVNNYKAINLYKKLGYKQVNIRKNYYYNKENALVMKIKLKN
ncbi:MAG: ribosomal protein S18-alanine N-acetyltransferase [bacterium]|jgi:ribosomal-protein-alanine N-acetyltransferase